MKALISAALMGFIFFTGTAQAYDLPKIRTDKKAPKTTPMGKSDWTSAENFEQKIKLLLEENGNIPASSKERINRDRNLIFVGFYQGNAYFLDKYSVKVTKNKSDKQIWKQHIYPISSKLSPQNSKFTMQKFCLQDENFYNSTGRRNEISKIENDEDRNFLMECFKVGYYYAFKKEIDVK